MSAAQEALALANARAARRDAVRVPIDYAAAKKAYKRQKAALTRAINSKNPDQVILVVQAAVREWNQPGAAWPDAWSRWERAVNDLLPWNQAIDIRDLA